MNERTQSCLPDLQEFLGYITGVAGEEKLAAGSWGQLLFLVLIGLLVFGLPALLDVPWETRGGATLAILYTVAPLETILSWVPVLGPIIGGLLAAIVHSILIGKH